MTEWSSFKSAVAATIKDRSVSKKLGGAFLALLSFIFAWLITSFKNLFWGIFQKINQMFPLPGVSVK